MTALRQFLLLMWKHFHLRKHRWFLTSVEIILPIVIAYLLCSKGGKFLGESPTIQEATIELEENFKEIMARTPYLKIMYTPENVFTKDLMSKAKEYAGFKQIEAAQNEQELEKFVAMNSDTYKGDFWIGIVFLNSENAGTKPSKLNYKIRNARPWHTDKLFVETNRPGPYKGDWYYFSGFAGIQIALDMAFIKMWNADFHYSKYIFQSFPYPEYQKVGEVRQYVPLLMLYVVILTSLILSVPLISNIIDEKETGVKELMKLDGLKEWVLQVSWFVNAIIFNLVSFSVAVFILQYDFNGPQTAVLLNVPAPIVWTCIILYCISNIAFCFTFTAIFHSLTVASSIFILFFCLMVFLSSKFYSMNSWILIRLSCLFPVGALYQGFQRIIFFENQQQKVTWSTLGKVEAETEGVSLLFAFVMLIFDTFFYLLLSQYISAINPGTFGSRKSPLFFLRGLSFYPSNNGDVNHLHSSTELQETKYFEKTPNTLQISISIKNLYKYFGSLSAVKNVNLDIYKGEITALLGHNGAGKTTTMAILTGMMKPTTGYITYQNRIDVLRYMKEFRKNVGFCPQENRLFPYLSVMNHLIFFGLLKGATKKDAIKEANEYLTLMEMTSKANSLSSSLSGGMKRKLSLSVALMGKVETLILDEPTSGMDVESRRKIWDLLLEIRGNRTIILTTHHMEEADALGDRIAIMNHGSIVCHGTPLFLKKAYGTGYKMTISRDTDNTIPLTNLITGVVPNSEVQFVSTFEIEFKLPLTETARFPQLFDNLEEEKDNLGIVNIGVSCTTMEQVFLKVGDVSHSAENKPSLGIRSTSGEIQTYQDPLKKKTGLSLLIQQLVALFWKKCLFMKRNLLKFFFRVLLPTIIMMMLVYDASEVHKEEPPLTLALSTYSEAKVMLTDTKTDRSDLLKRTADYIQNHKASVVYSDNPNIVQGLLDYGVKSLDSYRKELIIAASYDSNRNLLLYNQFAYHAYGVFINSISNIELEHVSRECSITTVNHPIRAVKESCDLSQVIAQIFLVFIALGFYTVDLCYYFSIFLSAERIDGFKHIQFMSNLSPFVYWLSNFIFDFVFFLILVLLRIVCFKLIDNSNVIPVYQHPFEILLLLLCCYITSGLFFTYVVNFLSKSKDGSYVLLLIANFVATIIIFFFYYVQLMLIIHTERGEHFPFPMALYYFLKYLILLVPSLNYNLAFLKLLFAWSQNLNAKKPICQEKLQPQKYLVFSSKENMNGILEEVIFLLIDTVIYAILLRIIEAGYLGILWNKFLTKMYERKCDQRNTGIVDQDVAHEKVVVRSQIHRLSNRNRDTVLLVQGLKKIYFKSRKPFVAVDDVNVSVKAGQCFGLLGVNGAGKSTCFQMLTGAVVPSGGDSSIQDVWLSKQKSKYLSKAGYCAQTNCFIEELTGRELLTIVASLRGLSSDQRKPTVDKWLNILGLRSYQNQKCGSYSGGNKRKLCTAMSLIGDPNVVFLDEPTAGVDPVSRRKLYDVMDRSKSSGQAVVLTSHSMEECENLCDRLTIMTGGQMKCIGTAQHLKQRYAQGFSILIKTCEVPDEEVALLALKRHMCRIFGDEFCNLKDEHKGLLYYQIKDIRLKWSQLFETMETMKRNYEIIEDYTVTDTSLEEVFMSFAKLTEIDDGIEKTAL